MSVACSFRRRRRRTRRRIVHPPCDFHRGPPGRPTTEYPPRAPHDASTSPACPAGGRQLINQKVASRMLEKNGHSVVTANNGKEALQALADQDFDAVLMDVQMPEMDGLEATAAIRAAEEGAGSSSAHPGPYRPRPHRRPRTLSRRRHGRLSGQADPDRATASGAGRGADLQRPGLNGCRPLPDGRAPFRRRLALPLLFALKVLDIGPSVRLQWKQTEIQSQ